VQESYSITSGVLDADPFAGGAYPVHLAAAVELRRTSDLFLLGHRCEFSVTAVSPCRLDINNAGPSETKQPSSCQIQNPSICTLYHL
jgi:hypothetical protein